MLSRRCLLALVAGLALLWNQPWSLPAAADEQSDRIGRLVKQLGSDRFAEHLKAQRELKAIGTPALPALRDAAKADDDLGRRAAELVRELEKKAVVEEALTPKKVRLKFKNTPVIDAVDELVRQSGYNIQIQGEVAALAKRKITLDTGETTFWQAFDRLCQEGGLVELASQTPAVNPLQQDPRLNPGGRRLRPLPLQPLLPRVPAPRKPRQMPGLPGVLLKVDNGADNGAEALALALVAVQAPQAGGAGGNGQPGKPGQPGANGRPGTGGQPGKPGQPGRNNPGDEQLKRLQNEMEKQLEQLMKQLEKQLGQGKPGQPKMFNAKELQKIMQLLRQVQQQQLKGMPQLGQPFQLQPFPQLGGWNRPGAQPVEVELPQLNVADGKPERVPTIYAGALRIRLRPNGQAKPGEAALALDISVEPRVYGFTLGEGSRVDRAVDDAGQALTGTFTDPLPRPDAGAGIVPRRPVLTIKLGDKQARSLKELRGQFAGVVLAPSEPLITVNDIFNAVGKTSKGANGGSIEILGVEKKGDGEIQVQLRLASPPFQADGLRAASLPRLLDAKGESYQLVQVPSRGRRSNGSVFTQELTMVFRANPGQGDPSSLVLNGVRPVNVQVPFSVANVPLPEPEKR